MKWRDVLLLMGCTAALVGSRGSDLEAQVVKLRPLADVSVPTRFSLKGGDIQVRQKVSLAVGARMTVIFSDRFDLVTTVSYSPGSVTLLGADRRMEWTSAAHSLAGSTGARYWVLPPRGPLSWDVHTRVSLAFGGQPAYEDLFEGSTLSGIVGTTVRYQVGRIVTLKLRAQQRLCRFRFGNGDGANPKRPFQVAFGLSFPFLESLR